MKTLYFSTKYIYNQQKLGIMKLKKTLLTGFICIVSIMGSYAQEHLMFKDIALNGDIKSFANELVKQGFVIVEPKATIIALSGNFVNRKCEVFVCSTKKSNNVWKVAVYLPKEFNWQSIKKDYQSLKEQFIKKYGNGKAQEYFTLPYFEGDEYEMQAINLEKCHYQIYWQTKEGSISLTISKYGQIMISYEDAINTLLDDKEKAEEIKKDI